MRVVVVRKRTQLLPLCAATIQAAAGGHSTALAGILA